MAETKLTRKEQAAETKKMLFSSALQLLREEGFDKITIRDIVRRAGVSIGTFYNYYTTKLDVYYETYIIADEYFDTIVKSELEQIPDTRKKLHCFFDYYARYNCEISDPALTRLLYNSDNKCFDRHSDIGMLPLLTSIIEEGLKNGTLTAVQSASEITRFLMISLRGLVYDWCTHDCLYDLRQAVADYSELLLKIFI